MCLAHTKSSIRDGGRAQKGVDFGSRKFSQLLNHVLPHPGRPAHPESSLTFAGAQVETLVRGPHLRN